jgi:hypothetical protein
MNRARQPLHCDHGRRDAHSRIDFGAAACEAMLSLTGQRIAGLDHSGSALRQACKGLGRLRQRRSYGDVISLVVYVVSIRQHETARLLAPMLGIHPKDRRDG